MLEIADDVVFGFAERRLIADLIKIARGFGPFAIEAANGQSHVLGGTKYLFDFAGQFEGGKMKHHADANAGADVGRAGGQISKAGVKCPVERRFDFVVDLVDLIPRFFQLQPLRRT